MVNELRFSRFLRVSLILPMTIAPVVVGVIWRLMYASDIGIVNPLFELFGLGAPDVLAHPTSAFIGVVAGRRLGVDAADVPDHPRRPAVDARRSRSRRRGSTAPGRCGVFFDHTLPLLRPC